MTSSKIAVITGAIASSYNPNTASLPLEFTIDGVTNPSSIVTTDSFQISIYYTEGVDVVSELSSGLTLKMLPNRNLELEILLNSLDTGVNNILQFKANTGTLSIAKGSTLLITIPSDFQIFDYTIAAATCLKITGFSDEITCTLTANRNGSHSLTVTNGFASEVFNGGEFTFNISQVRNPMDSRETESFYFEVRDSAGNQQYVYRLEYPMRMTPQAF